MAKNKMVIHIDAEGNAFVKLKDLQNQMQKTSSVGKKSFLELAAKAYVLVKSMQMLVNATKKVTSSLIEVADKTEQYRVRMSAMLGDIKEGNKVFEDMAILAGKVPKTYDEIMAAATDLSAVVKGGGEEINQLMPMIVDISAATGISVQDTTSQIIRMYSAGAASADMFQQRGISAALGFKAGVSYTNQETMDILTKQWEEGFGKFVGASEALATTFTGMTSMLSDAWFQFRKDIGEAMFEAVKDDLNAVLIIIRKSKEEGGEYAKAVDGISESILSLYENATMTFEYLLLFGSHVKDAWNEVALAGLSIVEGFLEISMATQKATDVMAILGGASKETQMAMVDNMLEMEMMLADVNQKMLELGAESNANYSKQMEDRIKAWKKMLSEELKEIKKSHKDKGKVEDKADKQKRTLLEDYHAWQNKLEEMGGDIYEKVNKDKLGSLIETLNQAGTHNKAFAQAGAVVAMGEAIVNTAAGVTRAFKDYAFPYSLAVGGLVAAAGAVQVATIASQKFAEGTDSVPSMLSPGEMVVPRTFADAIRRGDLALSGAGGGVGSNINIEINNPVLSSEEDIDSLVEEVSQRLAFETERIS